MGPLVVAAGLGGGAAGAAYLGVLALVRRGLGPQAWTRSGHAGVLVLVGLAVTLLVRGLGEPGDVELLVDNIHVSGGPDDVRSLRSLIPTSILCVGAGGPLGPEAPLVTTTGTLASWLGLRYRLERDELRILTIAGMAAGFTALFGAPLGSAVFALEILHRRGLQHHEALLPAAVGGLCGFAASALATGAGLSPIWRLPSPLHLRPADLGYAVAAGVVGAAVAIAFTHLSMALRAISRPIPAAVRPLVGAVAFAALAFASPYALTNGEAQLGHLATAQVTVGALLVAAAAKLVACAIALATGWRGGFIIPLFFVGFCLGRATAGHLPGGSSWALVAALMVACNVGVTKTPLGSTLVVAEMAGTVLLPTTLIAALVSLALTSGVGLIDTQRERIDPLEDP